MKYYLFINIIYFYVFVFIEFFEIVWLFVVFVVAFFEAGIFTFRNSMQGKTISKQKSSYIK